MNTKAKNIAIGGITAALTAVLCMLGALSVGGKILAPALCGIGLLLLKRYVSPGLAVTAYAASGLLLLLLPDRLTAAAYILLLGYYPMLCDAMTRLPLLLRFVLRAALLAGVGFLGLYGGAAIMGLWDNPKFTEYYPMLVGLYLATAVFYDLFLSLLSHNIRTRWDGKLRKLFR